MNDSLKKLIQHPFLQGSFYITVSSFIIGFLNYLFNIFAARLLGPAQYSDITSLIALIAVLSTPVAGFCTVIIQKIGARGDSNIEYAQAIEHWFYRMVRTWWPVFVLSFVLIPFTPQWTNISPVVAYSLVPFLIYTLVATVYEGIMQGLHLFLGFALMGILLTLLKLAGVGVAGIVPNQLLAIIVFLHISFFVRVFFSKWIINRNVPETRKQFTKIEKNILHIVKDRQVIITIVSLFAMILLNNIDIVYAKKMFSAHDAGLYSAWSLFAKIILYLFGPILQMSYIFFTSKKNESQHRIVVLGGIATFIVAGIVCVIAYTRFESFFINLMFGTKFLDLKSTLMWAGLFGIGYALVSYMNNYFLAKGSKKTLIFPLSVPFYIVAVLIYGKSIQHLMMIDAIFILSVFIVYLAFYLFPLHAHTSALK